MKAINPFDLMESLRVEGWCVVIKCLPDNLPWLAGGSRSEYDARYPDTAVSKKKWCSEAQWLGKGEHRHSAFGFGETPLEAMKALYLRVQEDNDRREQRAAKAV